MASIAQFEDIDAWKKARELARIVYELAASDRFARDFALRNQICRAAAAPMANIAEGFARNGDREFQQFLSITKGSVAEVQAHLYLALDLQYIDQRQFDSTYDLAAETSRLIGGFMRYLRSSDQRGVKFKNS